MRVTTVYVPNGRSLDHDQYAYKLRVARPAAARTSRRAAEADQDVIVCGDFNIAPEDRDVYDAAKYIDTTHTSPAERAALAELISWGLVDVFREHLRRGSPLLLVGLPGGRLPSRSGMRIDLMLTSPSLAKRAQWALIDRNARKGKLPSDHAPLLVDFDDRG